MVKIRSDFGKFMIANVAADLEINCAITTA
jgi:hypothetical protein